MNWIPWIILLVYLLLSTIENTVYKARTKKLDTTSYHDYYLYRKLIHKSHKKRNYLLMLFFIAQIFGLLYWLLMVKL